MLQILAIKDFALIEKVQVEWKAGLNVLTGETGAGKSILMDALNGVLGGKLSPSIIRNGAEKAFLEATFTASAQVIAWLKKQELIDEAIENEEAFQEVIIAREITKSGSKVRINGTLVNHNLLSELRALLITVHAQHEARTLMSGQSQLELVDSLGTAQHKKLLERAQTLYSRKRHLQETLNALNISEEERLRKLDFGKFQLQELEAASLGSPTEDDELQHEISVLANALELKNLAGMAQEHLTGGSQSDGASAVDLVQRALSELDKALKYDESLQDLQDLLQEALANLEDASTKIRRYGDGLDTDPETLQDLENRLAQLALIKRKYGPSLAEAKKQEELLQREIEDLENSLVNSEKLQIEVTQLTEELNSIAGELHKNRQTLATNLIKEIEAELGELGMEKCRFEIAFARLPEAYANGYDRLEFLISPNPGQPAMPLGKIASGGELSRIMLALKTIFAGADRVSTVVFDEIDTGLSGRVLNAVASKLLRLSRSHQILCITHQPIVASIADNYLEVKKEHGQDITRVSVTQLDDEMRLKSLAAMASGNAQEEASLSFARALIEQASQARAL
jgi:DNA repair protein RecN (Recombination protein N)